MQGQNWKNELSLGLICKWVIIYSADTEICGKKPYKYRVGVIGEKSVNSWLKPLKKQ